MINVGFTHLHCHSDASKDGLREVTQLVKAARDYGFKALAITDHGSLANAVSFTLACKSFGLKPIVGLEAYVSFDGETGHMTLLGNGKGGLENLIRLNNLGHAGKGKAPEFSLDALLADCKSLICLSGCVASPFNRLPFGEATSLMTKFKRAFGDRFFMEMMHVADLDTWTRPIKLSEKGNVPLVVTNDTHFPLKEDGEVHQLVTKMRAGFSYNSTELWLKTSDQIWKRARHNIGKGLFDDAVSMTAKIASRIKGSEFDYEPTLPHIPNADKELVKLVNANLHRIPHSAAYKKRIGYELGIISKMDYSAYFVILHDIITEARKLGAYIGPGRGSGAGSLVLYVLGITGIDPIEYELPFERFLNPSRKGMPDVDVDIDSAHRDVVIEYVAKKWKGNPIGTVVRYSHKTAVHDLSKVLSIPRDIDNATSEAGPDSKQMRQLEADNPEFEQAYHTIIGQIRHRGRHPAGVVITDRSVPIERASGHLVVSWSDGKLNEMAKAGIVKYDLLGLEALTVLQMLEKKGGKKLTEQSKIHEDDDPAFELFCKGDLSGVFQFSGSPGIRALTMKLAPRQFGDLIALNALYRPGALDAGTADKFVEWKKTPRKVPPLIADILAPTYGAIVYQEQVMALYARVTGGSLAESDNIRRIIVKAQDKFDDPEWKIQFEDIKQKFISGSVSRGISKDGATKIWDEIATHSRYSFNKAHSTAYAQIAWQTAWWKFYHPIEFYAAMMTSDRDNLQQYIFEVVERGIKVSMPTVNIIGDDDVFVVEKDTIVVPANVIKYVTNVKPIRDELKKGPFKSIDDFMARIPRNTIRGQARAALAAVGAFSGIKGSTDALGLSDKSKETVVQIRKAKDPERQAQIQFLGFFIPTKEDIKLIKEAQKTGMVAGVISEIKQKKSKFGPYSVFYLSPNGLFWARDLKVDDLKVGDIVAVKVRSQSGKATSITRIS